MLNLALAQLQLDQLCETENKIETVNPPDG